MLDGDPERIDRVYADGGRSIQVVHYVPNAAGDLQTQPAAHGGLSPLGKAMVKRMNARGMVIDVAHAAFATVKDVVSLTSAPIMLSHSILKIDDAPAQRTRHLAGTREARGADRRGDRRVAERHQRELRRVC
ncbi:MAG: membrane dipeptidase [Gemmatimonadetes bacterium]|nr:membrane dipeptidase [Gemmatimonadota bacterium]